MTWDTNIRQEIIDLESIIVEAEERIKGSSWLSVVVPVYQESRSELKSLFAWIEECSDSRVEWIIVGAIGDENFASVGSEVRAFAGMSKTEARALRCKLDMTIIAAPKGRSKQMNAGAKQAGGRVLLFLHADTRLAKGWIDAVECAVRKPGSCWGAFSPCIAAQGLVYRISERWGLWRSQVLGIPYGDQAIFIDAGLFQKLDFDETVQFMEDVDLARRLRQSGRSPVILPTQASTSSRRWAESNAWQSARNVAAFVLYMFGVPRENIRRWYER